MPEPRVTARQRQAVGRRANHCCEYCRSQAQYAPDPFSVEHIVPRHRGGTTSLDNLALSCQGCNGHKSTKIEGFDPFTNEMAPLYDPRRQSWGDHFIWSEDYIRVVGITPTGRVTVEVLQLNRQNVVNLRSLLYATRKHPPE